VPGAGPPKIREVTGSILRDPQTLGDEDEQRLKAIPAR
jgi:hypothetical protein